MTDEGMGSVKVDVFPVVVNKHKYCISIKKLEEEICLGMNLVAIHLRWNLVLCTTE